MNKGFTKISLIIGSVIVLLLALFLATNVFATHDYTPPVIIDECKVVTAPDPVQFEKKVKDLPGTQFDVYATYKWFEDPEGTWTLKVDIDPQGGENHRNWVSTYPSSWTTLGLSKPEALPQTIVEHACPSPTVSPEPTISPEPTPIVECQFNCGGGGDKPTFAGSSTNAPVCTDGTTVQLPANPHVLRNGSKATVNFFITQGDSANIYYKEVHAPNWQYSVSDVKPVKDNFVSVEIGGLDPKLGYTFGVQQKQGCGGGQLVTAVIVDGPQPVLFHFSYWEWSK